MDDWRTRFKNDELSRRLYEHAKDPTIFAHFGDMIDEPVPWWRRLWWWIDARYPRLHFGPCNHDECGYL